MSPVAPSLSLHRGQSRTGVGEGPGKTVLHGEQYIDVDAPLYDVELLDAIRPWMTLDSDPADHQRLNDQLEAWSLFFAGEYLFVARLVSAGVYDRRAAYFAHGRAWKRDAIVRGFDPGLYLGRSSAFDLPANPGADEQPAVVRIEQVTAETQVATRFLAHLLQAMMEGSALIIAAPVADFASGSALHALVGFARAGLPSQLQRHCLIRIYSRSPDRFVRHLGVSLIVVPEETASGALTARPTATLIDRQGRKIAGPELGERALEYASAVVERAVAIPDGLPCFTQRLREVPPGGASRSIPITYNVAFAFAGPVERRGELLRRYLPRAAEKLGPGLRWTELIGRDEWREFPGDALLDELLTDAREASEGRRELLRAAEDGAARLGLCVDERLPEWWDARDAGKLARLVELLAHEPPFVSPHAAAERTTEVPLGQLLKAGSLHVVLDAEARSGRLAWRAHEAEDLALAASDERVFAVLSHAVTNDLLDPNWARAFVATASGKLLLEAAQRWLGNASFFGNGWENVPELLLDRLRAEPPAGTLASVVAQAGLRLTPGGNLERYLRLADVLTRIDKNAADALLTPLWETQATLKDPELFERIAFDPGWVCLRISGIELATLLVLAASFRKDDSIARLIDEIDGRMRRDPETTTDALVCGGWWYFWRKRSHLTSHDAASAAVLEQSALRWLGSPFWTEGRGAEATLEAWDFALGDLPRELRGDKLATLRAPNGGPRRWPWIPPFEEEQLEELIDRAGDLGGLAELVEAMHSERWPAAEGRPLDEHVLTRSRFNGKLPPRVLGWLLEERYGATQPMLDINESRVVLTHAGHRRRHSIEARIDSIAGVFDRDIGLALRSANDPNLWTEPSFLSRIAFWMNAKISLAAIGIDIARTIDDHADGEPDRRPQKPSPTLMRALVEHGFHRAAKLLDPQLSSEIHKETLADGVVAALLASNAKHQCWSELAMKVDGHRGTSGVHPLAVVAQCIRSTMLSQNEKLRLATDGWWTFAEAARKCQTLRVTFVDESAVQHVFAIAVAMLPAGALGTAALQLLDVLSGSAWQPDMRWWIALVKAIRVYQRNPTTRSVDDRGDLAVALIYAALADTPKAQVDFACAVSYQNWPPATEFEGARS